MHCFNLTVRSAVLPKSGALYPECVPNNKCSIPYCRNRCSTTFCTPNRHFFILFRHIAIDLVTISLGLNRGSHYEPVHTCSTNASQFDMGHIIDRGHSISTGASALSKLNARCRLYDPSRTVVHYVIQVCTYRKRPPVSRLI